MSKIVLLTGSPRMKGNSMAMVKAFEDKATALGHEVVRFDTAKMDLAGCKACSDLASGPVPRPHSGRDVRLSSFAVLYARHR